MDRRLLIDLISIPLFTGVIGYITNWTGVIMMFESVTFHGVQIPGLKLLYPYLPRRVQILPVFKDGNRVGWQGMIPSRAEKMASLAIDKSLARVGTMADLYRELEPEAIAEHVVEVVQPQLRQIVDRVMVGENLRIWNAAPDFAKELVYKRVEAEFPKNAERLTDEIGAHLDELIDIKLMATHYLAANPELLNEMFRSAGAKELKFMRNFGFYFGYPMGFLLVGVLQFVPHWWVLPIGGMIIGWLVNYFAVMIVFEPIERSAWAPWRQGLLLRRRHEVIAYYAEIFAFKVLTIENITNELLYGARADRSMSLLDRVLRTSIDDAVGRAKIAVRLTVGSADYERFKGTLLPVALDLTPGIVGDGDFSHKQSEKVRVFLDAQMNKLSNADFGQILRSAVEQDEWLLFLHGGVLGGLAGFFHLAIFGA